MNILDERQPLDVSYSAEVVQRWLGEGSELWDFREISDEIRSDPGKRRSLLAAYRRRVVIPRVRAKDLDWFRNGIQTKGVGRPVAVSFHCSAPEAMECQC